MRWFRNGSLLVVCLALAGSALAAKKDGEKEKSGAKTERTEKKQRNKDKKEKKSKGEDAKAKDDKMSLPLVEGHDSKGLKIPYYDGTGKLQMLFTIGLATRLGDNQVKMTETTVETFDEEGKPDLTVELPTSVLDLTTRVVSSQVPTTIRRADFLLRGDTVEFDTVQRQGKLAGHVHMTIYNLEAEANPTPATKANE